MNHVVITGIGAVTPIGNNVNEFAASLRKTSVGIDKVNFSSNGRYWDGQKVFTVRNFTPPK